MSLIELLLLGAVIGANNLAMALSLGALGQRDRIVRIIVVFGLFEFTVPLIGIWAGRSAGRWLADYASWLSPALLIGLGAWILVSALQTKDDKEEEFARKVTTWGGLIALETGLSLDNLIAGFSLGLRDVSAIQIATVIALFSMTYTWAGVRLGDQSRRHWEAPAEILAGLLLIAFGAADLMGWI